MKKRSCYERARSDGGDQRRVGKLQHLLDIYKKRAVDLKVDTRKHARVMKVKIIGGVVMLALVAYAVVSSVRTGRSHRPPTCHAARSCICKLKTCPVL